MYLVWSTLCVGLYSHPLATYTQGSLEFIAKYMINAPRSWRYWSKPSQIEAEAMQCDRETLHLHTGTPGTTGHTWVITPERWYLIGQSSYYYLLVSLDMAFTWTEREAYRCASITYKYMYTFSNFPSLRHDLNMLIKVWILLFHTTLTICFIFFIWP